MLSFDTDDESTVKPAPTFNTTNFQLPPKAKPKPKKKIHDVGKIAKVGKVLDKSDNVVDRSQKVIDKVELDPALEKLMSNLLTCDLRELVKETMELEKTLCADIDQMSKSTRVPTAASKKLITKTCDAIVSDVLMSITNLSFARDRMNALKHKVLVEHAGRREPKPRSKWPLLLVLNIGVPCLVMYFF